jgi:hypothetical protein
MRLVIGIVIAWMGPLSFKASADDFFDRGFAVGTSSILSWISHPIPTNFIQPEFHQSAYEIRRGRILKLASLIKKHQRIIEKFPLRQELKDLSQVLEQKIAELDALKVSPTVRCLLLNEQMELARFSFEKYLVNSDDAFGVDTRNQLKYELQPEDLYGFLAALRILTLVQTEIPLAKKEPFYLTYADLWSYLRHLQSFRKVLESWTATTPTSIAPPTLMSMQQLHQALANPYFQKLNIMIGVAENEWRGGKMDSLRIDRGSAEYEALLRNIKSVNGTSQLAVEMVNEQLRIQKRNVRVADLSCADLLLPMFKNVDLSQE